ncbi:uncharacterized protein LOC135499821 [Lineus longissimus]|uniref:uncharacterized protein LOC135499821 n=1 Tax=Lineus longissimus TaxID=88925 RepID=UPI002B4CFD1E
MSRLPLFVMLVACFGVFKFADAKRKLYRKARSFGLEGCEDEGGFILNDICYILGLDMGTWEEARQACEDEYDGDLAVVVKKVVYDYILDMMDIELDDGSVAWIGLSDLETEGLFEWVDGYVDYEERGDYWDIFWEWSGDSLDEYPNKDCVVIDRETGEAKEKDCNERHFYVCEIIAYPDEWELELLNEEIEWENDLVEMLSNASVMQRMEIGNKGSLDDLYELDIKLNREEAAIFKSGGDPSSATGAFTFKGDKPTHEELMAIKRLIEEHGIESWDPATREYESRRRRKRSALGSDVKAWPGGVVPYEFNSNYPAEGKGYVYKAMRTIENDSCITFVVRTTQDKYMIIGNSEPSQCYSSGIGYPWTWYDETRNMNFGWCWNDVPSIIHELYHALGFWHEMSRPDRDDYIEIIWKNVQPGEGNKFQFQKAGTSTFSGYPYDYLSIMHYPLNAMAIDQNKYTMKPKKLDLKLFGKVGNQQLPTKLDKFELNTVYKCDPKYIQQISAAKDGAVELEDKSWGPCSATCGIGQKKKELKLCTKFQCYVQYTMKQCFAPACPKPGEIIPTASTTGGVAVKELAYTWGGCWNDDRLPSSLASLEGKSTFLDGKFKDRSNKIQKCANAAKEHNSEVFALKFGGKCIVLPSTAKDKNVYKANGPSEDCKGIGVVSAIDVYLLNSKDVQGEWGSWAEFDSCTKTCAGGVQTRKRVCNNPKPKGSGAPCKGQASGTGPCSTGPCPVDGGWGNWGPWDTSDCEDYGIKSRVRKCDNPKPQIGGRQCWDDINFIDVAMCEDYFY